MKTTEKTWTDLLAAAMLALFAIAAASWSMAM